MKNYLILYCAERATIDSWKNTPEEQQASEMEAWIKWMESHNHVLKDPGNPVGKNIRVTANDASARPNEVCGYSIVKAESSEDAARLMADSPHFDAAGTYIEVMEIVEM